MFSTNLELTFPWLTPPVSLLKNISLKSLDLNEYNKKVGFTIFSIGDKANIRWLRNKFTGYLISTE